MMAGNPNWWNMHPPNSLYPSHDQFVQLGSSSSSSIPLNSLPDHTQEPAQSWSQFLLGGLSSEEDRLGLSNFQTKKLENWEEDEILNNQVLQTRLIPHHFVDVVKQEEINLQKCNLLYGQRDHEELMQSSRHINNNKSTNNWLQVMPVSSPVRSCITTTNNLGTTTNINNILDFSFNNNKLANARNNPTPDQSSECNSTASGGVCKKARVQPTSTQPPLKVRKEKLGDRITALHQLVSPFGKTDTASVLLEAIGYIRFLQSQIEALSSPYLGNVSKHMRTQHYVENGEKAKDLRSRGLCLVPLSCTQHVGSDNIGADYWAPACDGRY